jgi:MoaA/NifB/PqqE/SkfB family radical SAM enzyme
MHPKICLLYVTLQCNDTCEFCSIWRGTEYSTIKEAGEPVKEILKNLRIRGMNQLVITGGEPLLLDNLAELAFRAKELGYKIDLTTNGILYQEKATSLSGLVDRLYFSLDYPIESEHDRSRGIECYKEVLAAIKLAKSLGENPIINFTLTRDSIRFLPEMIELADRLGVFVYLNPVYDFFGTQGFETMTIEHIKYYRRRKNVLLNLAVLDFVKAGGNKNYLPRCLAKETTITVLPDGRQVAPCFFNVGGQQGREDVCSSCMRWPYMLPSFSRGLDRYFWLNLYSNWLNCRKEKRP